MYRDAWEKRKELLDVALESWGGGQGKFSSGVYP